jgi:hypothetical protein
MAERRSSALSSARCSVGASSCNDAALLLMAKQRCQELGSVLTLEPVISPIRVLALGTHLLWDWHLLDVANRRRLAVRP